MDESVLGFIFISYNDKYIDFTPIAIRHIRVAASYLMQWQESRLSRWLRLLNSTEIKYGLAVAVILTRKMCSTHKIFCKCTFESANFTISRRTRFQDRAYAISVCGGSPVERKSSQYGIYSRFKALCLVQSNYGFLLMEGPLWLHEVDILS